MPGPKRLTEREFIDFYIESFKGYFLEEGQTFLPNDDELRWYYNVQAKLNQFKNAPATLDDLIEIANMVKKIRSGQFTGARNRADQVLNKSETYRGAVPYKKSRKRTKKKKKKGGEKRSKTKRLTTKRRRKSRRKSKRK